MQTSDAASSRMDGRVSDPKLHKALRGQRDGHSQRPISRADLMVKNFP